MTWLSQNLQTLFLHLYSLQFRFEVDPTLPPGSTSNTLFLEMLPMINFTNFVYSLRVWRQVFFWEFRWSNDLSIDEQINPNLFQSKPFYEASKCGFKPYVTYARKTVGNWWRLFGIAAPPSFHEVCFGLELRGWVQMCGIKRNIAPMDFLRNVG